MSSVSSLQVRADQLCPLLGRTQGTLLSDTEEPPILLTVSSLRSLGRSANTMRTACDTWLDEAVVVVDESACTTASHAWRFASRLAEKPTFLRGAIVHTVWAGRTLQIHWVGSPTFRPTPRARLLIPRHVRAKLAQTWHERLGIVEVVFSKPQSVWDVLVGLGELSDSGSSSSTTPPGEDSEEATTR